MKNIVGAKENVCPHCQGTMLYIKINKAKVLVNVNVDAL